MNKQFKLNKYLNKLISKNYLPKQDKREPNRKIQQNGILDSCQIIWKKNSNNKIQKRGPSNIQRRTINFSTRSCSSNTSNEQLLIYKKKILV